MVQVGRVLFPTDLSALAESALPYAAQIARAFGAELHLFHATILHELELLQTKADLPERERVLEALEEHTNELLHRLVSGVAQCGLVLVQEERRAIAAAPAILDYADQRAIDLIVMATHGRRGLRHFFLGSVAEEVVRHAQCAVLTVRGQQQLGEPGGGARLLVPVDFSETTAPALAWAEQMAAWSQAEVELLHAIDVRPEAGLYDALPPLPPASIAELERSASERLEALVSQSRFDPRARATVVHGAAVPAILDRVEATRPHLLILGSHGRTGVMRWFLGSVAERIVNRAPCPVLTVKGPRKAREEAPALAQAAPFPRPT